MLSEEQTAHFFREGYVCVTALVSPAAVDRVVSGARAALETALEAHLSTAGCEADEWFGAATDLSKPADNDPDVHSLIADPAVVEVARETLGTAPYLDHGMLAQVAPGGRGLPWHQDNMYIHFLGGAINIFIALMEITPDMGGLWVAPRSHLHGVRPSRKAPQGGDFSAGHRQALEAPDNGIPMPTMQPGDACVFDRSLLHRSVPNTTDRQRLAYSVQLHAAHARLADGQRFAREVPVADWAELVASHP